MAAHSRPTKLLAVLVASLAVALSACGGSAAAVPDSTSIPQTRTGATSGTGSTTLQGPTKPHEPTPTTQPVAIGPGTPEEPFSPLPESEQAPAVVTPSGVVLPVVSERSGHDGRDSWVVITPCADVRIVSGVDPLGRAHVVLDPGHGGRESGAAANGLVEKDLNLAVAQAAKAMLESLGATVILTRSTDVTMTTGVRAALARTIDPALFVSIHHNGGAPATGHRPGTIVFTKSNSEASTRFGGLFHQALMPQLIEIGEAKQEEFRRYAEALTAHEESIAAYDRSLVAREAALVANGQLDPTATTLPQATEPQGAADRNETPSTRTQHPTTTMPVPDERLTVPVPDTIAVPPPFDSEPVARFNWAGTGNAGVRSWRSDDGRDLLSVLRRSGQVPAALVEYLYLTNPVEADLLADPAFIELEATALTDAVVSFLSTDEEGDGFVADQVGDQNIGGGGHRNDCIEPDLGLID